MSVDYTWDPRKAEANRGKHDVDFADAATVFSDEMALNMPDDNPDEDRYVIVGLDALGRLLAVVYTWRGESIRIISARRATARERRDYEGII
jgi:hypothetical protein